jgi:CheY-like chemotaxis protein
LREVERAALHCAEITNQLLTFRQERSGEKQIIDLGQLVRDTVQVLERELPDTIEVSAQVVPGSGPVLADSTQLQQALLYLARNACDAMPQGGRLSFHLLPRLLDERDAAGNLEASPGHFALVRVRDTGHGMTEEIRSRLFEPFFTTKAPGQGNGMGLAMVYGIVKAHRGWITVESSPGDGATFDLFLPAAETSSTALREGVALGPAARTILVVDDEEMIRILASTLLERSGFQVLTAGGGEEALALYQTHHPRIDAVLLDVTMPGMNGLEVFEELKKINPHVAVVFSSGFARDRDSAQLLATGARAFLPKPYQMQDLLDAIGVALKSEIRNSKSER